MIGDRQNGGTAQRPPHVKFEHRAAEDRDATIKDGVVRYQNVPFVILTSIGSRDTVEKPAEEWLSDIGAKARRGDYPTEWVATARLMYEMFSKEMEVPENGTPIILCPFLNPAEQKSCLAAGIKTLEDLAASNEEAIRGLGLNGRILKSRAQVFLSQTEGGKAALQMEAMSVKMEELTRVNSDQSSELERLKAIVSELQGSKKK